MALTIPLLYVVFCGTESNESEWSELSFCRAASLGMLASYTCIYATSERTNDLKHTPINLGTLYSLVADT